MSNRKIASWILAFIAACLLAFLAIDVFSNHEGGGPYNGDSYPIKPSP